jgi:hypothetical protein
MTLSSPRTLGTSNFQGSSLMYCYTIWTYTAMNANTSRQHPFPVSLGLSKLAERSLNYIGGGFDIASA